MQTSFGTSARAAIVALAATISLSFGCKPKAASLYGDADSADAEADVTSDPDFGPLVPKSASLPGDFSPPKDRMIVTPPPPVPPAWFGFEPFPGAELLCAEQVAAASTGKVREIHWATYGIAAPGSEIIAFYKRRDAGALEVDRDETTFALGKTYRLSVVRLPTSQPYPRCEHAPKKTHKAIVVVSQTGMR